MIRRSVSPRQFCEVHSIESVTRPFCDFVVGPTQNLQHFTSLLNLQPFYVLQDHVANCLTSMARDYQKALYCRLASDIRESIRNTDYLIRLSINNESVNAFETISRRLTLNLLGPE